MNNNINIVIILLIGYKYIILIRCQNTTDCINAFRTKYLIGAQNIITYEII